MWLCVELCLSMSGFRLKSLPKNQGKKKKRLIKAAWSGTQNSEIEKAELGEKSDKCLREVG